VSLEDFKEAWKELEIEEAKRGFAAHLIAYIIVNSFLVFVNLYARSEYLWVPWVLAAWGIGITFHFALDSSFKIDRLK
jgi:hypothetical protein